MTLSLLSRYRLIAVVFCSALAVSCDSSKKEPQFEPVTETEQSNESEKTDVEQTIEDINTIGNAIVDGVEDIKEIQEEKEQQYQETRDKRWVYQIGDLSDNGENIFTLAKQLENVTGLAVFKTSNKKYFLFKNDSREEFELTENYESFKNGINLPNTKIEIVDLIEDCSRKQQLIQIDDIKLGSRKDRIFLPCYTCMK